MQVDVDPLLEGVFTLPTHLEEKDEEDDDMRCLSPVPTEFPSLMDVGSPGSVSSCETPEPRSPLHEMSPPLEPQELEEPLSLFSSWMCVYDLDCGNDENDSKVDNHLPKLPIHLPAPPNWNDMYSCLWCADASLPYVSETDSDPSHALPFSTFENEHEIEPIHVPVCLVVLRFVCSLFSFVSCVCFVTFQFLGAQLSLSHHFIYLNFRRARKEREAWVDAVPPLRRPP